jgi:hypothetical protein
LARVPQKRAQRGSQRWIQLLVNEHPLVLDTAIGAADITWLSPLAKDKFAEYSDADSLTRLGVAPTRRSLESFWPVGGPQWDALGRAASGEVILVDANAHIPELLSPPSQTAEDSVGSIRQSLAETANALGAIPGTDWSARFRQYTNRLAHGHFLHNLNRVPTRLVFLYLIGDEDVHGPRDRAVWDAALAVLYEALGIRGKRLRFKTDVFIDIRGPSPIVV